MKYPATERPVNNGTQWKRPVGDTLIINSFPRGFCASSAPSNHCQEALALMMMTVLMRDCRASFGTVAARPFLLAAAAHYRPLLIHLFRADRRRCSANQQLFHFSFSGRSNIQNKSTHEARTLFFTLAD